MPRYQYLTINTLMSILDICMFRTKFEKLHEPSIIQDHISYCLPLLDMSVITAPPDQTDAVAQVGVPLISFPT